MIWLIWLTQKNDTWHWCSNQILTFSFHTIQVICYQNNRLIRVDALLSFKCYSEFVTQVSVRDLEIPGLILFLVTLWAQTHHLWPLRNLNPKSQSYKQNPKKTPPQTNQHNTPQPTKLRKHTFQSITQKNYAQFNNLFKGIKYHGWIHRLPERVQIKGKKMHQYKQKNPNKQ